MNEWMNEWKNEWMNNDDVNNDNNDNDKRLGLTAKADHPDHKKIQYTKNKNGQ